MRTLKPGALSTVLSSVTGAGRRVDAVAGAGRRVDAVAGAGCRGDDPGFAESLAQGRDRDAHGVGERVGVLVPCPLQELFGADDTTFGCDENFEHGELLPGQRDVAAVPVDLAAERIQP